MAESSVQEVSSEDTNADGSEKPPISGRVGKMSDRAIQRVTGGNAFLRGRLYARRNAIENLTVQDDTVSGEIRVRSADEPYKTSVKLTDDGQLSSACTCPGWRGPDAHCKHVAAILVALRDKERPPKPKETEEAEGVQAEPAQPKKKKKAAEKSEPVHVAGTVSVGGTRRRNRRRRGRADTVIDRLAGAEAQEPKSRGPIDAWLPPEALPKPCEFEYRVAVRPTSVNITPVVAGTRNAAPIEAALAAFNMVDANDRPLFRLLSRHATRGQPATAELRGEDAA
jgi:hypothetical protein